MTATTVLSVILILAGGYLCFLSWWVLIRWLQYGKHTSWPPFLAGVLLAGGLALLPWDYLSRLWWLAFLLDYGSIPNVIVGLVVYIRRLSASTRRAGEAERRCTRRDRGD